jgi:hypothetical protein
MDGQRRPSPGISAVSPPRRAVGKDIVRGRVKVHDPFELVRWLALSQPDPRKALAELVQNSLDAGAHRVTVTRLRERGVPCLRVLDDGEGVIPELSRAEALRYVATHVGHSRKRSLSPQERLQLMTQGQYGIGLLGFWCLGETLEIRSSLADQRPHRLVLYRDRPDFLIEPIRTRALFAQRATEVVVSGLHREALAALVARRAADYLAAELRGQLLAREVELTVEDRVARGPAEKIVAVRPRRFLGEPIALPERVEGIPEPELADFPGAPWRSRLLDGRWQVNSAHPEYRAIAHSPPLKVRYLALLFAKEVVLRSAHDTRLEGPLEQLVEIAAYADRNLAGRRRD